LEEGEAQRRRLQEQLLTVHDEERTDLARELHDEIGAYLFAVSLDAANIERLADQAGAPRIVEQVRETQAAIGHIQRHVRDILLRLRPVRAVEFGLEPALNQLVAFWRVRRPEVAFAARFEGPDDTMDDAAREALYRVAQESLQNALRHAHPTRIDIEVGLEADGDLVLQVTDNGALAGPARGEGGFGLQGMRERMRALAGSLDAGPIEAGGWRVRARLPAAAAFEERMMAQT
jgi:two-component system sensor histidine kinase UhpB